jgi:hypothetical protein
MLEETILVSTEKLKSEQNSIEESKSNSFLNQVSLDYLINTKQYKIHLKNIENKKIDRKDKKFYRRRIYCIKKNQKY